MEPPEAIARRYVNDVVSTLHRLVEGRLRAAYLIGSLAMGDYVAGRSDIDVLAVCDGPVAGMLRHRIVARLSHPTLPCPARGLEFVLYEPPVASAPTRSPRFAINLNTGPGMEQHASFDASSEPAHWFLLDIAIARQRAIPLFGPQASAVFAPVPLAWALDALLHSLDWHTERDTEMHNSVLNACRSWRFAEEGVFDSKTGAAAWARNRGEDGALIDEAVAIRAGEIRSVLDPPTVRGFVSRVRDRVARAAARDASGLRTGG